MLIHFDKLRISDDNKHLSIKIRIGEEAYYENVYLTGIKIWDKETYGTNNTVWTSDLEANPKKEVEVDIPLTDILTSVANNMLFISVDIQGVPSIECPCGGDTIPTAVFADTCSIMNTIKSYTSELSNSCITPKGFINYLLLYKALEYAIKTCHYPEAIKYYNMLLKEYKTPVTTNCGCHG